MGFFSKDNKQKELELQKKEENLNYKAELLKAQESNLETAKHEFDEAKKQISEKLDSREKEIDEKEIELNKAKIDFEPKQREAESGFAKRNSETDKEIEEKISNYSKEILKKQEEYGEKLHTLHQQMEAEHEAKLVEQTNKRIQETDEELLERRNQLAEQERNLREEQNRLKSDKEELNQKIREHEISQGTLEAAKQNVLNKEQCLDKKAEELADAKIRELTALLENYKEEHTRLSKERADLETQINTINEINTRLNGEDPAVILTKIQSLQRQVVEYKRELASYPDDVLNEIAKKDTELKNLSNQRDVLNQELLDVKNALSSRELDRLDINSLKNQNNVLKNDNERYELLVADQSKTIREFRDLYEKETSIEDKIKTIMAPHENFTEEKIRKEALFAEEKAEETSIQEDEDDEYVDYDEETSSPDTTTAEAEESEENNTTLSLANESVEQEIKWFNNVSKKIKEYGLEFSLRILKAFHTALKTAEWSPLAVLAGVSGTGKSELPQLYAKFGGINCLNVPVQPNWDSQEAMLGYYNTVSSKFEAQPLLQYLVQTQTPNCEKTDKHEEYKCSLKDQMNIVLLDEMNLAHIEQYFAEFLSKLEERRGKKEEDSQFPALAVKLGGTDAYPLPMGRNVLWVGTMNQDETTKSLSDKVLDRGIVINFPRPDEFKRRLNLNRDVKAEEKYLSVKTWNSWKLVLNDQQVVETEKIIEPYKKLVEKINKSISNIGRAIGHRVWQSIENYIWNYPDVRKEFLCRSADLSEEDFKKKISKKIDPAFEDQLVQKIMPKLRGIETRGESKKCLDEIRTSIETFKNSGHALNIAKDFDNAIKFGDGQFLWVTSEYLNETSTN
ncbi:MAG: hypothetical protein J6T84_10850 [Spirochaetaceae bacterium]|nr:hypothetical protein [Spirochaetaceae bacterium]